MTGLTNLVSVEQDMATTIYLLTELVGVHLRANRGGRDVVMMAHLHVVILLERLKALRRGYLGGKAGVVTWERHGQVHQMLLLLKVEGLHGRLGCWLTKAQSSHGSVEARLSIIKASELEIRLKIEKLGEVIVAHGCRHGIILYVLRPYHRILLVLLWHFHPARS